VTEGCASSGETFVELFPIHPANGHDTRSYGSGRSREDASGLLSGERPAWCFKLPAVAELGKAELNAMVAEAIVDAHDQDEQVSGFYSVLEEHLAVPFRTTVLGMSVTVNGIGLTSSGITAICVRGKHRQEIPVLSLPLPDPPPAGWEWIAAYRHWAR
jgi:hypothetical protein